MRLAEYLKETGTTQAAFGQRIGRSQSAVRLYAAGERFPDDSTTAEITRATLGRVTVLDLYPEAAEAMRAFHPAIIPQAAE